MRRLALGLPALLAALLAASPAAADAYRALNGRFDMVAGSTLSVSVIEVPSLFIGSLTTTGNMTGSTLTLSGQLKVGHSAPSIYGIESFGGFYLHGDGFAGDGFTVAGNNFRVNADGYFFQTSSAVYGGSIDSSAMLKVNGPIKTTGSISISTSTDEAGAFLSILNTGPGTSAASIILLENDSGNTVTVALAGSNNVDVPGVANNLLIMKSDDVTDFQIVISTVLMDIRGATQFGADAQKSSFSAQGILSLGAVGASTYSVVSASGVRINAGGLRFPDGTSQFSAASGGGSVTVSSSTVVPESAISGAVFGVALATVTLTTRGFPVYLSLSGTLNMGAGTTGVVYWSVLIDGATPANLTGGGLTQKAVAASGGMTAANTGAGAVFTYPLRGVSAGTHTFAIVAVAFGSTVTLENDAEFVPTFTAWEAPE